MDGVDKAIVDIKKVDKADTCRSVIEKAKNQNIIAKDSNKENDA